MEPSQIREFYKNSNVFLTGATGFLGKILIEKLMRDTEVETIYILVREKKGQDVQSRLSELLNDEVFFRLKQDLNHVKSRIKPVAGDASLPNLGLSNTDRQILISKVDVVFHVAASVNFTEPLKDAYNINVGATIEMLKLAKKIKHLKAYVHVSTAFSNCNRRVVAEDIYEHPYKNSDLKIALDKMSKTEADNCTEKILGDWPNTYTFTKALAENVIKKEGYTLPIGIFRPSIVISTYKEPVPGWIDNINGPTGVCMGVMSGVIRVLRLGSRNVSDMVPVDTCVAGLIASAWDVCQRFEEKNESIRYESEDAIPVYNFISSNENPIIWKDFVYLVTGHFPKYPYSKAIWTPVFTIADSRFQAWLLGILLHHIPAIILDFICIITGRKAKVLRSYKKVYKFLDVIEYFITRDWQFCNKNVKNLWRKMNNTDKELFPMSMKQVSWLLMFDRYIEGIRKNILKDSDDDLKVAMIRDKR